MNEQQNPDVNSFQPEADRNEVDGSTPNPGAEQNDSTDEDIPLPPDVENPQPVREPDSGREAPIGDIDDSPKRIVNDDSADDPRF